VCGVQGASRCVDYTDKDAYAALVSPAKILFFFFITLEPRVE